MPLMAPHEKPENFGLIKRELSVFFMFNWLEAGGCCDYFW